jgi:hypothetical protein
LQEQTVYRNVSHQELAPKRATPKHTPKPYAQENTVKYPLRNPAFHNKQQLTKINKLQIKKLQLLNNHSKKPAGVKTLSNKVIASGHQVIKRTNHFTVKSIHSPKSNFSKHVLFEKRAFEQR